LKTRRLAILKQGTQADKGKNQPESSKKAKHPARQTDGCARGQEIEQEGNAEVRVKIEEQRAKRNRVGDAVGDNIDVLFARGTYGEAPIPGTEAHHIWLTNKNVNSLPTP
jgi:hypothetical protein